MDVERVAPVDDAGVVGRDLDAERYVVEYCPLREGVGIPFVARGLESLEPYAAGAVAEREVARVGVDVEQRAIDVLVDHAELDSGVEVKLAAEPIGSEGGDAAPGLGEVALAAHPRRDERPRGELRDAGRDVDVKPQAAGVEVGHVDVRPVGVPAVENEASREADLAHGVFLVVAERISHLAVADAAVDLDRRQVGRREVVGGGEARAEVEVEVGVETLQHGMVARREQSGEVLQREVLHVVVEIVKLQLVAHVHIHRHAAADVAEADAVVVGRYAEGLEADVDVAVEAQRKTVENREAVAAGRDFAREREVVGVLAAGGHERRAVECDAGAGGAGEARVAYESGSVELHAVDGDIGYARAVRTGHDVVVVECLRGGHEVDAHRVDLYVAQGDRAVQQPQQVDAAAQASGAEQEVGAVGQLASERGGHGVEVAAPHVKRIGLDA